MSEAAVSAGASLLRIPVLATYLRPCRQKKPPATVSLKPGVNLRRLYVFVVRCSEKKYPRPVPTQAGGIYGDGLRNL